MSTYGVTIASIDTNTQWGLILCADLVIGTPPLKSNLVDIPGRDGTVNMSYVVNGPVYGDRQIAFSLFCSCNDDNLNQKRAALAAHCHGQVCDFYLPMDATHYYRGLFNVGPITGFNSGKIPVSVIAEPYAYKTSATTVSKTLTGSADSVTLNNEQMPASATLVTSGAITLVYDGTTYTIAAGTKPLPFKIPPGGCTVTITGTASETVSITYQEGRI